MTQRKPEPTAIELFLAPLSRIARKSPEIEGLVFWGSAEGWDVAPSEALEAEEITFYAEGLLLDGFPDALVAGGIGGQSRAAGPPAPGLLAG